MKSFNVSCPIHKNADQVSLFWEFVTRDRLYSLYKCQQCDLLFYSPFPEVDYEVHTDGADAVKDYVHLNSNIEGLIENLLNHIPVGEYKTMLEVGCGFGFTLDFAKQILGMDVVGYEPSLYGEMGASELAVNIKRKYLTDEDVKDSKADIIFLSEVLEHIEEPLPFLRLLKSSLTDKGVFILTTPDYTKLKKDISIPSDLALLSPGAHTILYGKQSLASVLKQAGFENISLETSNNSLVAICSTGVVQWKKFETQNELIRIYYKNVLKRVDITSLTYIGVLYRLLRNYIDFGDYAGADDLLRDYTFLPIPSLTEIEKINSVDAYYNSGASCNSLLSYYLGILNLNYYGKYDKSAILFEASYQLCKKKLQFVPDASVVEFGIIWLSKYHQAISLLHLRNFAKAVEVTHEILEFRPEKEEMNIPLPDKGILEMTKELQRQLLQEIKMNQK